MPQNAAQRSGQAAAKRSTESKAASKSEPSGTEAAQDHVYGLVSVLYHSLQGVQACNQYAGDAQKAGEDELVKFFEECRSEQRQLANRAKQLLAECLDEDEEDDEGDNDDAEEEEDTQDGR